MNTETCVLTNIKLDKLLDLARGDVHLDGVVDLHQGVRVADGASVVCNEERYPLRSDLQLLHFTQLVLQTNNVC